MSFIKGSSILDGKTATVRKDKRATKIKERRARDEGTKKHNVGNGVKGIELRKEEDGKTHEDETSNRDYKAKPLPKMSDGLRNLAMKDSKDKTNKIEKNAEERKPKERRGNQTLKINKYRTYATKSSIVNESEEKRPTETWVIRVTNGAKHKTRQIEKSKSATGNNITKKSGQAPTTSSNNISTPTKQTLHPTTIRETPRVTSDKLTSKGTPSKKPTTEAASTPTMQNENSGSGLQSADSEQKNRENGTNKITNNNEVEIGKVEGQNENKFDMKSKSNMMQAKDELNEESISGDEEGEDRDGITEEGNKTEKEMEKRILCVGDSITEGYYNRGSAFHPYTKKLSELLNAEKNHITYIVYNEGKSGECIEPDMIKRMPLLLEKYKKLNLVIILGGTNDLTKQNSTEQNLFENIKKLHEIVHKAGIRTVAVTIPDSNAPMLPGRNEKETVWENVNDKIREFAIGKDNIILCDLAEELPYRTMSDDEKKLFWDDDLHFNPMGYDKMAEIIYDVIQGNF